MFCTKVVLVDPTAGQAPPGLSSLRIALVVDLITPVRQNKIKKSNKYDKWSLDPRTDLRNSFVNLICCLPFNPNYPSIHPFR